MTKFFTTVVTVIFLLLALAAVSGRITAILGALVPVILVTTIAVGALRVLWFYTR
jgi:hypothetical protein